MSLNKKALGLACGLLWGGGVFVTTIWVMVTDGGAHLSLLSQFYLGYSVSPLGSVIGFIYGFVDGFVTGWILGWLYNRFAA